MNTIADLHVETIKRVKAQRVAVANKKSHKPFEVVYEVYDTVLGKVEVIDQIGETCPKRALKRLQSKRKGQAYDVKAIVAKHKKGFVTYKVFANQFILR